MAPNPAKTGQKVTFTATSAAAGYSWDLNGDGVFGDKTGSPVTWYYAAPGPVGVGLQAPDASNQLIQTLQIDGPSAAFVSFPAVPVPGELVTFVYSSTQATPPDSPPSWDLNGDGLYGDATGSTAFRSFPAPGVYPVGLEVTDLEGAVSTSMQPITVKAPPAGRLTTSIQPRLMTPFPIVRITGRIGRRGARIKRLTVTAPYGASITVRCRGKGCPVHLSSRTVAPTGRPSKGTPAGSAVVRIRKLEKHLLRVGANVKVYVSKSGAIGKFTRFRIRKGKPPLRRDLCIVPGKPAPVQCPAT
jgi:PKD repeat protein